MTLRVTALLAGVILPLAGCVNEPGKGYNLLPNKPWDSDVSSRLFGGSVAEISDFPSAVCLSLPNNTYCGGAIISPKWVVTTGLCTFKAKVNEISIRVGTSFCKDDVDMYRASALFVHEKLGYTKASNNIALVKVEGELKFNGMTVGSARLLDKGMEVVPGEIVKVLGWGGEIDSDTRANKGVLRLVDARIMCLCECKELMDWIFDDHFCTYNSGKMSGIDTGDSGGPVYMDDYVIGVVSGGWKNKTRITPDKIVKLSFFREWIRGISGI